MQTFKGNSPQKAAKAMERHIREVGTEVIKLLKRFPGYGYGAYEKHLKETAENNLTRVKAVCLIFRFHPVWEIPTNDASQKKSKNMPSSAV